MDGAGVDVQALLWLIHGNAWVSFNRRGRSRCYGFGPVYTGATRAMRASVIYLSGWLVVAAFPSISAVAATANYDLHCTRTSGSFSKNGSTHQFKSGQSVDISIDLNQKIWCSRVDNGNCGTVTPLKITPTEILLKPTMRLDRRSGALATSSELGGVEFHNEYRCTKAPFHPIPKPNF